MKMKPSNKAVDRIVEILAGRDRVLVVTHVYPDGDALGSQLALGNILESMGKEVYFYSEQRVSHLYDFMPGCERLATTLPELGPIDAVIALDCGDRFRLGREMDRLLQVSPFIVIDHHVGHKEFGDIRWVEGGRSSTAEMVYDLAMAIGADVSAETAYCLYAAIVSDTGSFKYDSTTAHTFRVAAELVAKGVDPSDVAEKLFDNYTRNRLALLEVVLSTLELHNDGQIAIISATRQMFSDTGAAQEDTEDIINYPRALSSVKVAAFIKETPDGQIAVSLRAKGACDVAEIALEFGGGGHRNAAGFRQVGGNAAEVRAELLKVLGDRL